MRNAITGNNNDRFILVTSFIKLIPYIKNQNV
jgi:hypothetical protein